jgi:hypothetical protein
MAGMVTAESASRCPKEPSSSSTPAEGHDNDIGQSSCPSTSASSDNLKGYTTPSGTWDSQSSQANGLQSAGGSSTYLISHHLDGNETPQDLDTGASTPTSEARHPMRSLCHTLHEKIPEPPYHVFPSGKKKTLMYLAAVAGMFSSLSANIYFPALGQISRVCMSSLQ